MGSRDLFVLPFSLFLFFSDLKEFARKSCVDSCFVFQGPEVVFCAQERWREREFRSGKERKDGTMRLQKKKKNSPSVSLTATARIIRGTIRPLRDSALWSPSKLSLFSAASIVALIPRCAQNRNLTQLFLRCKLASKSSSHQFASYLSFRPSTPTTSRHATAPHQGRRHLGPLRRAVPLLVRSLH